MVISKINPHEFARKYFGEFSEENGEIIPKLCPYCHGGQHHDKKTFAMNVETGVFNCKRGSCGMKGTFFKIMLDFGEVAKTSNFEYHSKAAIKNFTPSTAQINPPSQSLIDYLATRKISKATADKYKVGSDGIGNICFPYIRNGERVAVKYRPARKLEKGEQKMFRETGTDTTTLFGMQLVDVLKPLIITEGEFDCLSLSEAGAANPVSVPNGSKDLGWIEVNWDWLDQFKEIIICGDTDAPGHEMTRNLVHRLGEHRCLIVNLPDDSKDANECLIRHGPETLRKALANAQPPPIAGVLRLADVESLDLSKTERFKTGIYDLDKATGGLFFGQTTVVTGNSGSGKSTLLGQLLLEAREQGYAVCAFSGELPAPLFRYWIDLQAAGPDRIKYHYDPIFDQDKPYVSAEDTIKIREWYRDKFFIFDNATAITPDNVLLAFEHTAQRYNCRVFLIDNLMMLMGGSEGDYYHQQGEFMKRCSNFAKRFNAHVLVCAHPRKVAGPLTKSDISGTADITNLADNVLALSRLTVEEKAATAGVAILEIFKTRFSGQQDVRIGLLFDEHSKRFYQGSKKFLLERVYGWRVSNGTYELPDDMDLPF